MVGIAIIWSMWFIILTLDVLICNYEMIDRVAFILLFLIILMPLFFGFLLNPRYGITIGFLGTLIPSILLLNSGYGGILIFLAVMILSMSSGSSKLINNNTRQEELIILHQGLKRISDLGVELVDWTKRHELLTYFLLTIVGGLIVFFITRIIL